MNKRDLAAKIARDCGLSKVQASATIDSLLHGITLSLKQGRPVTFPGFGTFTTANRAAHFAAGRALKAAVRK